MFENTLFEQSLPLVLALESPIGFPKPFDMITAEEIFFLAHSMVSRSLSSAIYTKLNGITLILLSDYYTIILISNP